jgi:2-haloalkanoic acid dehalogenase type II
MPYKALLLDFYGTLVVDDDRLSLEIAQAIVDASPLALDVKHVGDVLYAHMERLCDITQPFRTLRRVELDSLAFVLELFQTSCDLSALTARLFAYWQAPDVWPEAHEFVDYLQRTSLPTCIVSDVDNADLEAALRHTGWQFANQVTSEACQAYKPRPEMFERALTLLNCQPKEVLYVGDSWASDVRGAHALGIDVAWINRDARPTPNDSIQPTFIISNLHELYPILSPLSRV